MSRFSIHFDSASTAEVRKLCVALHRAGHTAELQVGVNGPEAWAGRTPMLNRAAFQVVLDNLEDTCPT